MNVYTSLLFLHGHFADSRQVAGYDAPSYGNAVANDRLLRERWEPGAREGREDDIGNVPKAA